LPQYTQNVFDGWSKEHTDVAIYENLALEGGGTKGHIYMGAALELERLGILKQLQRISGASAGAIAALLFATGWPVKKIQEMYSKMDFETMAMGGILDKIWVPRTMDTSFGAFDGRAFHAWFKEIVKEVTGDPNCTFKQWHELKEKFPERHLKDLFIEACNMETQFNETFSYLSEHADVAIADAVFASMKFPGMFTPFEIKNTLYFDGGAQRNCPSESFENKPGEFNDKTLSIRLDHRDEINYFEKGIKPPKKRPKNLFQALAAQFGAATKAQDYAFFASPYKAHTIFASTGEVGTLDFDLTDNQKKFLIDSGSYSVKCYFSELHPELAKEVYDPKFLKELQERGYPLTLSDFEAAATPVGKLPKVASIAPVPAPTNPQASQALTPLYHARLEQRCAPKRRAPAEIVEQTAKTGAKFAHNKLTV
jgi:NTE family protein